MRNIRTGPATFDFQLKFNYIISLTGKNTFLEYSKEDRKIQISTDLSHNLRLRSKTSNETLDAKELELKIDEIISIEFDDYELIFKQIEIISRMLDINDCSFFLKIKIANVHEIKVIPQKNIMNQLFFEKI